MFPVIFRGKVGTTEIKLLAMGIMHTLERRSKNVEALRKLFPFRELIIGERLSLGAFLAVDVVVVVKAWKWSLTDGIIKLINRPLCSATT